MPQRVIDFFCHEIQGGLEHVAHPLIIRESFFATVYVNQAGVYLPTVFLHHRVAEVSP